MDYAKISPNAIQIRTHYLNKIPIMLVIYIAIPQMLIIPDNKIYINLLFRCKHSRQYYDFASKFYFRLGYTSSLATFSHSLLNVVDRIY